MFQLKYQLYRTFLYVSAFTTYSILGITNIFIYYKERTKLFYCKYTVKYNLSSIFRMAKKYQTFRDMRFQEYIRLKRMTIS